MSNVNTEALNSQGHSLKPKKSIINSDIHTHMCTYVYIYKINFSCLVINLRFFYNIFLVCNEKKKEHK